MPVGCGNSRMAGELPVRRMHARYGAPPPSHCGEPPPALEARLPHAVPLHPAARAPGPRGPRQGLGTHGAAPPAQRPTPPGPTTQAQPADRALLAVISRVLPRSRWSCSWSSRRRCRAGTAAWSPHRGPTRVAGRATAARRGPAGADRPPRARQSALGLPAHPRRAAPAGHPGLGHRHPHHLAPPPAWSRAATGGHDVAGVPAPTGYGDHCL